MRGKGTFLKTTLMSHSTPRTITHPANPIRVCVWRKKKEPWDGIVVSPSLILLDSICLAGSISGFILLLPDPTTTTHLPTNLTCPHTLTLPNHTIILRSYITPPHPYLTSFHSHIFTSPPQNTLLIHFFPTNTQLHENFFLLFFYVSVSTYQNVNQSVFAQTCRSVRRRWAPSYLNSDVVASIEWTK